MELAHLDNLHCLLRWNALHPRHVKAKAALVLLTAGCRLNADEYEIHSATIPDAQVALSKADDGLKTMYTSMEPFQAAAARRLFHALELLSIEPLPSRVAGGPGRLQGTRKVYPTAAFLASRAVPEMSHLMDEYQVVGRLIVAIQEGKNSKNNWFLEGCHDALVKLSRRLNSFRTLLQSAPPSILET